MRYAIFCEPIREPSFPPGYYYAHIPTLDLTTHGLGIVGAREAAEDLIRLWIDSLRAHGEPIPPSDTESYFYHIEIPDAAVGA